MYLNLQHYIILCLSFLIDTVLYSYAPGANVDPAGGGTVIPLSPSVGE